MTGAMYAGISGLKTHMQNLNVIGHNLANVNTYGYKTQRMIFRESLYGTKVAGSDGTLTRGGVNPSQIGYGVEVGTIDLNMASSTYTPTGYPMDCMIDGDGFFLVGDKDSYQGINSVDDLTKFDLTRLGDFNFDPNGYLVDGAGRCVYGFATVQNPNYDPTKPGVEGNDPTIISSQLVPLRLPLAAMDPNAVEINGKPGTWQTGSAVYPAFNVDPNLDANKATGATNVDPDKIYTISDPDATTGKVTITQNTGNVAKQELGIPTKEGKCVQLNSIKIGENGIIQGVNEKTGETVTIGCLAVARVVNPDGVTHVDGPYYRAMEGSGDITVGAPQGALNTKEKPVNFLNNKATGNPDEMIGEASEIRSSGLEASSADVATEFASMITTQRGYQANTRLITVTDSMLEELVNMKR